MNTFAERFRALRVGRGWTQEQAAEELGISRATIAGYEGQKSRIPRPDDLQRIASIFGVSIDYLLGRGSDSKSTEVNESLTKYIANPNVTMVPVVAEIACGEPIYAEDRVIDHFPINPLMVNVNDGPYVWVIAKGDSMVGAGIKNGSLVLIRLQSTVNNGDIAAACVDNEAATIKKVYFLANSVMLQPENDAHRAQEYAPDHVRIVGKVVSFITKSE